MKTILKHVFDIAISPDLNKKVWRATMTIDIDSLARAMAHKAWWHQSHRAEVMNADIRCTIKEVTE